MEIVLLRHGQTNYNLKKLIQGHKDNPLNDEGINQAKKAGEYLKNNDYHFDIILSSNLIRAKQTANIVKEILNHNDDIIINKDFIERDFGKFEGLSVPDYINIITQDDFKETTYEDNDKIRDRVSKAFTALENTYKNKKVLIVCHSHTIKALLSSIDKQYTFNTFLTNASLHEFTLNNKIGKIKKFNISVI